MNTPLFGVGDPGVEVVERTGCDADDFVPQWCIGEQLAAALGAEVSLQLRSRVGSDVAVLLLVLCALRYFGAIAWADRCQQECRARGPSAV